jgi:hypothetical protein
MRRRNDNPFRVATMISVLDDEAATISNSHNGLR